MNRVRFELWVEVSISIRVMVSIEYFIILKQFQCCSRSKPILNVIRKSISFGSSDYCSSRTPLNTPKPDQNQRAASVHRPDRQPSTWTHSLYAIRLPVQSSKLLVVTTNGVAQQHRSNCARTCNEKRVQARRTCGLTR
jgi:hypothetical protein